MTVFYDVTVTLRNGLNTGIQKVVKAILSEIKVNEISPVIGGSNTSSYFFEIEKREFDEIVIQQLSENNTLKVKFLNSAKPFVRQIVNLMNQFYFGRELKEDLQRFFLPSLSLLKAESSRNPIAPSRGDSYVTFDAFWASEHDFRRVETAFMAKARVVIFVHDLFPISHPDWFEESSVISFKKYFTRGIELADILLFSSNSVLREFEKRFPENKAEKFKLPMGVGINSFSNLKISTEPKDNILMIGTLEPRKNYLEILNWYEKWDGKENLVIVGRDGWKSAAIKKRIRRLNRDRPHGKTVIWKSNISDSELSKLLNQAKIGICASLDEGYGLPLREFISYGIPIVASDIEVFREDNYDGVVFFQLGNNDSISSAVESQLKNPIYPQKSQLKSWPESYDCLIRILTKESLSK